MITADNELVIPLVASMAKEGYTEKALREIFDLRKKYNAHVYAGRESPPEESFEAFVRGWLKMPQQFRARAERDYARGYAEVVRAGAEAMQKNASLGG